MYESLQFYSISASISMVAIQISNIMIHSFSCKNFYSFGDLTTLDFTVNDKAPKNNGYFTTGSGTRLSKVEAVIGPNASGKTNLLRVLPFLKWLIVDSFNMNPDAPILVQSFAFGEDKDKPIELSVEFEINDKIYTYDFVLNKQKIISEKLESTSFVKEKNATKKLFSRTWNEAKNGYDFEDTNFELPKGFENALRMNASVIGAADRLNHPESREIATFWRMLETNTVEGGSLRDPLSQASVPHWFEVLMYYSDNDVLKKEAEKLLSRFDLGLDGILIDKKQVGNGMMKIDVQGLHLFKGQKQQLPIQYESAGTKQLFILLKTILKVLGQGGIAVLDEIDVNLHPEMVLALFDLFVDPNTNSKNAQLLLSTHSHLILSKLDKYQIVLVEKNKDGISESWRLDEMGSDVRADDNYYAKYIAGAYGAVPKI